MPNWSDNIIQLQSVENREKKGFLTQTTDNWNLSEDDIHEDGDEDGEND